MRWIVALMAVLNVERQALWQANRLAMWRKSGE
jgi:hypothetical protein